MIILYTIGVILVHLIIGGVLVSYIIVVIPSARDRRLKRKALIIRLITFLLICVGYNLLDIKLESVAPGHVIYIIGLFSLYVYEWNCDRIKKRVMQEAMFVEWDNEIFEYLFDIRCICGKHFEMLTHVRERYDDETYDIIKCQCFGCRGKKNFYFKPYKCHDSLEYLIEMNKKYLRRADTKEDIEYKKYYDYKQIGLEFIELPCGTFKMGSEEILEKSEVIWKQEKEKKEIETRKPIHEVSVKAFWISKYPVTQEIWKKVMGYNPSQYKGSDRPVERVSWDECQEFCRRTSLRLPTEAEWEFACRAGTTTRYYWGNEMDGNYCWYWDNSGKETHPVGRKKPNEWGLYDMSGNVWEWCEDFWHDNYNGAPLDGSAWLWISTSSDSRICRGGAFENVDKNCCAYKRLGIQQRRRSACCGFRVCKSD